MHNFIIYGGTFDPIHKGHIETALAVQNQFSFERFKFLPCKAPVLKKQALATPQQRVKMLEIALMPYAKKYKFETDLSEINRYGASYMIDSLQYFRAEFGSRIAITLLMGIDVFNQLHQWHAWLKLISLCNILVINRTGYEELPSSNEVRALLIKHETQIASALLEKAQGIIYRYDAGRFNFSSTWIRKQLGLGIDMQAYLPRAVLDYINQNQLYLDKPF